MVFRGYKVLFLAACIWAAVSAAYAGGSGFGGTVSVGSGEAITSLTNPGGLFDQLNAGTVGGNVTVNLTSDLTAETGVVPLNQTAETGIGGYTIFFQASGGPRLVEGSHPIALMRLNGADRIIFSGIAFGPGGLTIRNTGGGSAVRYANDAVDNSIVSCVVEGVSAAVIYVATGITTGNDNLSISDSVIRNAPSGGNPSTLIFNGSMPGVYNTGMAVNNNQLSGFTSRGIWIDDAEDTTLNNNTITSSDTTQAITAITAELRGTNSISRNTIRDFDNPPGFTGIELTGVDAETTVSANRIRGIRGGSTGDNYGIVYYSGDALSTVSIVNNMVSLVPVGPAGTGSQFGIVDRSTAGTVNVLHNSVYLGGSGPGGSYAFRKDQPGSATVLSLSGNILFNGQTGTGSYFAAGDAGGSTGWSSDHNVMVGTGSPSANIFELAGAAANADIWRGGPPARDAASLIAVSGTGPFNLNNIFVSAEDLHLVTLGNNPAINNGTDLGITVDFDGQGRPINGVQDIGADEVFFAPTAADASINGRITTAEGRGLSGVRVIVTGGDFAEPLVLLTTSFGYYRAEGLRAGQSYIVSVSGKRYVFDVSSMLVQLGDDAMNVNFTGRPR
jgi:hypothetical protein